MLLARRRTTGRARRATPAAVALLLALAAFAPRAAAAPPRDAAPGRPFAFAEFRSEVVRLSVEGDSLTVEGRYRFHLEPGVPRVPILYPFPRDARLGGARMVALEVRIASGPWRPLAWREAPAEIGVVWDIPAELGDAPEVRAVYRQGLRGRWARYIVTTTSSWGRPLDRARFELLLPPGEKPRESTYAFRAARVDGRHGWVYEARRFAPERDVDVAW